MVSVSSAVKCFCMFDRNDYVHTMKEAIGFSDKSLNKYYNRITTIGIAITIASIL